MSTWSFKEAMDSANAALAEIKTKGGAPIVDGTYKASDGKVRSTVGRRIEIAKFAIAHGVGKASKQYETAEHNIMNYTNDFRAGKYKDVPPDALTVPHKKRESKAVDDVELARLTAENVALREMIDKLIAARR